MSREKSLSNALNFHPSILRNGTKERAQSDPDESLKHFVDQDSCELKSGKTIYPQNGGIYSSPKLHRKFLSGEGISTSMGLLSIFFEVKHPLP